MTSVDTDLDLSILDELEFEPACEGAHHAQGTHGHNPEQPASWLLILGCGHDWQCCDAWLKRSEFKGMVHPSGHWAYSCWCGHLTPDEHVGKIPLRQG